MVGYLELIWTIRSFLQKIKILLLMRFYCTRNMKILKVFHLPQQKQICHKQLVFNAGYLSLGNGYQYCYIAL